MNNIDIYTDFNFGGKSLSDFQGYIHTTRNLFATSVIPERDIYSETLTGIGEVYTGATIKSRKWNLDIFFDELTNIRGIAEWLSSPIEKEFFFIGDSVKINCICENASELEMYTDDKMRGEFTLTFVAFDPYYYNLNDKVLEFTTFSQEIVFNNDGNRESFPILEFELNGLQNVKFKLNGENTFEIREAKDKLVLNSIYHTCRDIDSNRRKDIIGYSPAKFFYNLKLKCGENKFQLVNGSVRKLTIHPNSRYI
ncbi:MAG: phage tail family protein [Veillonella parvula]|uniref:Phage tail family protein n=1 Tax=Veillonella parvula TaxID=29466 RepID=A0A942WT97_VEIPA|nr:phage tail domain-containing protein [Veillonella parvula]MBS4894067.1 phage tail family protein [Veillonella parvula]